MNALAKKDRGDPDKDVGDSANPNLNRSNNDASTSSQSAAESIREIEGLVDHLFMQDRSKVPEAVFEANPNREMTLDEIDRALYHDYGENLFSKASNKFFYKLCRIFGFWDEALISFIDKDHMKQEYHKARQHRLYPAQDFLEHFLISYGIQTLNDFREKRLKDLKSFRKIVMSTSNDVAWTKGLLDQAIDINNIDKAVSADENDRRATESRGKSMKGQGHQAPDCVPRDIFNFSFKILTTHAFRKYGWYGMNLGLDHSVADSIFEQHQEKFTEPDQQELSDHLKRTIREIEASNEEVTGLNGDKKQGEVTFVSRYKALKALRQAWNQQGT